MREPHLLPPGEVSIVRRAEVASVRSGTTGDLGTVSRLFLDHLRYDRNCYPGTLQKYESNLRRFRGVVTVRDATALRFEDFTDWKRSLAERGLSASTANQMIFTIRALLRFCREYLGLPTVDPSKITILKVPQKVPEVLTLEEQSQFLEQVRADSIGGHPYALHALRFLAFVLCLRSSGARISELLGLNRTDVDFEAREARVLGKGGKERPLYFSAEAIETLRNYMGRREDDHEALFVYPRPAPPASMAAT